jgi:hypothetical protein
MFGGNSCDGPPTATPDTRLNLSFRIYEIDNGYVLEYFNGHHRPMINFFSQAKVTNIPLFISQMLLQAIEEKN